MAGKIDLIITKSISRFARNTVDTLVTVRELKEKGVEVYFEKENIYTLDNSGELIITIMSSLAQEESRSISENVKWGKRKRFAEGVVSLPYSRFLGFRKGKNGIPEIVEEEAKVVRMIYSNFLDGDTPSIIAKKLTAQGIKTPCGKDKWSTSSVRSILSNEKYKGSAILQKTYIEDFLTKKIRKNDGELPQYYIEKSHEAIIAPRVFEMVQLELEKRKIASGYKTAGSPFSGKLVCDDCGHFFGSKVWHSTSKYKRVIWQCNNKFKSGDKCKTPHLNEKDIESAFMKALEDVIDKAELIQDLDEVFDKIYSTEALETKLADLEAGRELTLIKINKLIAENASTQLDAKKYNEKYSSLASSYEQIKADTKALEGEIQEKKARGEHRKEFMEMLEHRDSLLAGFDAKVFTGLVETVRVNSDGSLLFCFKDGSEAEGSV
ncbi:MAG: recombinase family protein [Anaerovoracaceae bacterium]